MASGLFSKITAVLADPANLEKAISLGFGQFDKDKSGTIEKSELLSVLEAVTKALGITTMPPATTIDAVFGKHAGADGVVDKEEFGALVKELFHKVQAEGPPAEAAPAEAAA